MCARILTLSDLFLPHAHVQVCAHKHKSHWGAKIVCACRCDTASVKDPKECVHAHIDTYAHIQTAKPGAKIVSECQCNSAFIKVPDKAAPGYFDCAPKDMCDPGQATCPKGSLCVPDYEAGTYE